MNTHNSAICGYRLKDLEPCTLRAHLVCLAEGCEVVDKHDDALFIRLPRTSAVVIERTGIRLAVAFGAVVDHRSKLADESDDPLIVIGIDDCSHMGQVLQHGEST